MKLIIGGSIAIVLAVVGIGANFGAFLKFMAGIVPISLLLGGCVALYLYREMRCDACEDEPQACCEDEMQTPGTKTSHPEPQVWNPASMKSYTSESKPVAKVQEKTEPEPVEAKEEPAPAEPGPAQTTTLESGEEPEQQAETPVEETPVEEKAQTLQQDAEEAPAAEPAEEAEEAAAKSSFIGNTDSMVFHTSNCKFSTSKKCTAFFNTAQEALEAGFKACGVCKP